MILLILLAFGYSQEQVTASFNEHVGLQFIGILLVEIITVGALYGLYRFAKRPFWQSIRLSKWKPRRIDVRFALTSYALYFASFLVVGTVASLLLPGLDTEQMQQLGFENPAGGELAIVFASLVILPSLAEEIIFRGVLYQRLKKYISLRSSVILTSLVFGAAHLELLGGGSSNWIAAIDTTVFGAFLILAYEKAGSLWSPILLHATKNSIAFVYLFII